MTRQYSHIGSRTIAYLDSAPGDRSLRALVLLHAFPIGANLWEPQVRSVPKGWRLITPDLRGFGGSTELDSVSALSMADYADDVVDLLQELSVKQAVIGGCSMGGYATLALYQSAPQLFDGLVLANTRAGADSQQVELRGEGRVSRRIGDKHRHVAGVPVCGRWVRVRLSKRIEVPAGAHCIGGAAIALFMDVETMASRREPRHPGDDENHVVLLRERDGPLRVVARGRCELRDRLVSRWSHRRATDDQCSNRERSERTFHQGLL